MKTTSDLTRKAAGMELKQYAAEHIIENGKHYPEKWVNRYFIELADAQRAFDVERGCERHWWNAAGSCGIAIIN